MQPERHQPRAGQQPHLPHVADAGTSSQTSFDLLDVLGPVQIDIRSTDPSKRKLPNRLTRLNTSAKLEALDHSKKCGTCTSTATEPDHIASSTS